MNHKTKSNTNDHNCDTCAYAADHSKCKHNCIECKHKDKKGTCLCFISVNSTECKYYEEEQPCPLELS